MVEQPRAGVLVTRRYPQYKDVPGLLYHYPKRPYQRTMERLVGSLVVFYEPRRGGISRVAATGGRSAFVAFAFVNRTREDPADPTHAFAELRYYLDFTTLVPVRSTGIPGRALQTAVKEIPYTEAQAIVTCGLALAADEVAGESHIGFADVADLEKVTMRPFEKIVRNERVRDASFRYRVVEQVYRGRCALTGVLMTNGNGRAEADAAHIRPVERDGPDTVVNGLALMKSLHWAFDRGLVSLANDGRILTVERGLDDAVRRLLHADGMAILPDRLDERPHPAFLRWHRENVFKGAA